MRRKRLFVQLFASCLLLSVLSLLAVGLLASRALRVFYLGEMRAGLAARARMLEGRMRAQVAQRDWTGLDALCKEAGASSGTRLTVILPDGRVVADSHYDPLVMVNHADRSEVVAALKGDVGERTDFSYTLQRNMLYVAVPMPGDDGAVAAVIRASLPLHSLHAALRGGYYRILVSGMAIAVLAAAFSWRLSRRISEPLEEMRRCAERFADGDFGFRVPADGSEEVSHLAEALNRMAMQLDERIQTVALERNEKDAMLMSMVEGVFAVDANERMLSINQAAAEMLAVTADAAMGRHIQETVRIPELQRLIALALDGETVEGEVVLQNERQRVLHARGTALRSTDNERIGALLVLDDVTRIRRLENLRRDFVANVSHELKTPITSIKGFVETLLDNAGGDPDRTEHFLNIVSRQVDRLNAIIEDLLLLSRIEQDADDRQLTLEDGCVRDVLASAMEVCTHRAEQKGMTLALDCPADLKARLNAPLFEQAVVNLIDNAVKYSAPDGRVAVAAAEEAGEVRISVRDWGAGIPSEHMPRLFERFYRVDTARSRKMGGTGLGLAIVKHIVQAHGGRVAVSSKPGEGSTFTVSLPLCRPTAAPAAMP